MDIEYKLQLITSSVKNELYNQLPFLKLPVDVEVVTFDQNKAFGYVVVFIEVPVQVKSKKQKEPENQVIELFHFPYVYDNGYVKFLFTIVNNDIYPFSSSIVNKFLNIIMGQSNTYQNSDNIISKTAGEKLDLRGITKYNFYKSENKKFTTEKKKGQKIPERIKKKIKSKSERQDMPKSYFLLPNERKFPYKDPDTGEISCPLLHAAITRAAQHNYPKVEQRARKLYERHCKSKNSYDILLDLIDNETDINKKKELIFSLITPAQLKYAQDNNIDIKITSDLFLDPINMRYLYKNPVTKEIDLSLLRSLIKRAYIDRDWELYGKVLEVMENYFDKHNIKIMNSYNMKEAGLGTFLLFGVPITAGLGLAAYHGMRTLTESPPKESWKDWFKNKYLSGEEWKKTFNTIWEFIKNIPTHIKSLFTKENK